jgi:5'-nucleotidase / UDP-sugar diphosphatase
MRRRSAVPADRRACGVRTFLLLYATMASACSVRATRSTPTATSPAPSSSAAPAATRHDAGIHVTILQLNDLYEITPTAGGRYGGPARVATIRKQLVSANPNTITILAGDFLSPSALGTARVDGTRLDGRQMVDVLDAMGLDIATFGNHEFDLGETVFRSRLRESRFEWVSSNVAAASDTPLPNVARHVIRRFARGSDTLRIAFTGATMDRDQRPYASVSPPLPAVRAEAAHLRDSADVIIALTHLPIARDIELVESTDSIDLVLGGHEHENMLVRRGEKLVAIAKADANARTVYVHDLDWDPANRLLVITSRLVSITDSVPADPATDRVANDWVQRAYAGFRESGFEPEQEVAAVNIPLDGLESSILVDTTSLSQLIGSAMAAEVTGADGAVYNAGSIRLDDVMPPGPVRQYDIIRILPFGGPVIEVEMRGSLLRRVLEQGMRNRGTGGFVQRTNIERSGADWTVGGQPLDDARTYHLAVSEYLISGREQGMSWLSRDNAEMRVVREGRDIRFALMDEMRRRFRR